MPELTTVLTEADLKRGRAAVQTDLTPYMDILDTLREQGGVGGVLSLDEGESQRTVKRRKSIAAKERGYQLTWRKAPAQQFRFVLAAPGEAPPDARRRRARVDGQGEPSPVDTVVAEDPAASSGMTETAMGVADTGKPRGRGRRPAAGTPVEAAAVEAARTPVGVAVPEGTPASDGAARRRGRRRAE